MNDIFTKQVLATYIACFKIPDNIRISKISAQFAIFLSHKFVTPGCYQLWTVDGSIN
jgi:hypothetical protein